MMLRSVVTLAALSLASLSMACSSSDPAPTGGQGTKGPGSTSETVEKNSYGKLYPTQNLGRYPRTGNTPGNVMKNYKFRGYKVPQPGAAIAPGSLEQVSLVDYFDPDLQNKAPSGEPYRVLHITVSSVWCTPCNEETKEIVGKTVELADKGVIFLTAIADGSVQGKPAEVIDFDGWIKKHKANYTHVMDPSLTNFGEFFDAAAVPFNADVDLRSMEILYAGTGAPQDISAHVEKWINWTKNNPAQGAQ